MANNTSNRLDRIAKNRSQRANRVRATVSGTADRPRLSVHISNRHIIAQVINDEAGKTLAYAASSGQKLDGTMTERAAAIGNQIAKQAKTAKVKKVVLDRGSKLYHGRVAALADAARKEGLEL
jgi:large subunit ribosomal protein L18